MPFNRNPTKIEVKELNELRLDLELAGAEQDLALRKVRKKYDAPRNAHIEETDDGVIRFATGVGTEAHRALGIPAPDRATWEKLLKLTDRVEMLQARHRLMVVKLHKVCDAPLWAKIDSEACKWVGANGEALIVTVEDVAKVMAAEDVAEEKAKAASSR